ncbi:hypothetical protein [Gordonia insulae]|uniref:Integral membrane protein n=1 Tax=Gordonia insulae TaxID=2420509 RepID=A0A3G8JRL9_9ACTN|nr:hypothetical protein [Gordonia insulae]AZG47122.1 hypothetical protein D7316_03730 [Gordonia insulae]
MAVAVSQRGLAFSFPEVHDNANLTISFIRTLRVPDDETTYGLPPGLGSFELVAAGNCRSAPAHWDAGHVVLPMWQSEASWINFSAVYPFLVRIGVGGINAVTGEPLSADIDFATEDYVEVPIQPWLDGFRTDPHTVRQFVAVPLGQGYSVAEQLSGADDGSVRIEVIPLRGEIWDERSRMRTTCDEVAGPPGLTSRAVAMAPGMGLGAGGSIKQSIATPIESRDNWHPSAHAASVLHIVNSAAWQALTGHEPHHQPLTIAEYRKHDHPWFEWYDDSLARQGTSPLTEVKSVREVGEAKGETPLPDNESFTPPKPKTIGPRP